MVFIGWRTPPQCPGRTLESLRGGSQYSGDSHTRQYRKVGRMGSKGRQGQGEESEAIPALEELEDGQCSTGLAIGCRLSDPCKVQNGPDSSVPLLKHMGVRDKLVVGYGKSDLQPL